MNTLAPKAGEDDPLLALLRQALAGDPAAMNHFLAEVRPFLKELVEEWVGNHAVGHGNVSDVIQECLLAVWQHANGTRAVTDRQLLGYLEVIARNEVLDAWRDARRHKRDVRRQVPLPDSDGSVVLAADTSTPSHQAMGREAEELRQAALCLLSDDDQQVIRLRVFQGFDWDEVARQMGRSKEAVKQLYYRASGRWRRQVEGG